MIHNPTTSVRSYVRTLEEALVRVVASLPRRRGHRQLVVYCVGGDEDREGRADWELARVAQRIGVDEIKLTVIGPSMKANCALYHEWERPEKPDFVVMFHPGLWGYPFWELTLRRLLESGEPPILVTSYTIEEAELDEETVGTWCSGDVRWLWKPELNPFASETVRPTATAPKGHVYRENAAWQCILPPP